MSQIDDLIKHEMMNSHGDSMTESKKLSNDAQTEVNSALFTENFAENYKSNDNDLLREQEELSFDNSSNRSIGSGQESDIEDNVHSEMSMEPSIAPKGYDPSIDERLPETVTLLTTPSGSKLYLVGTMHFSEECQNEVSQIIQAVQPHRVIVELCQARLRILLHDEESLLEEARKLNFNTVCSLIKESGVINGLMYILMLNLSAHLTKELGMAPGGEFRRAFIEASKVPNCIVGLGDRPIQVTMQRLLGMLSWRQRIKLGWNMLTAPSVTKEEMEDCKRPDFIEQVLLQLGDEYPEVVEVLVNERDIFLTHSLQLACKPVQTSNGLMPVRVVGVVGLGHANGISKLWGKVKKSQIPPILSVPQRSLTSKIIRLSIKTTVFGALVYVGYRMVPIPSFLSLQSMRSSVMGLLKDEYEHLSANIIYVTGNVPGPGVDPDDFELEFSVGCSCRGRCNINCSCTRGTVNYVNGRKVAKTGPIIECNKLCSCDPDCGNRLVQNGPINCLFVSETSGKGLGLFTKSSIEKGTFICEYAGEVIGIEEAKHRIEMNKQNNQMNYVLVYVEFVGENTQITTCIDPAKFGNICRYSNHNCQPNTEVVTVRVDRSTPRVCLFASKNIEPLEEVTFHYAEGVAKSVHRSSGTPCLCGSSNCEGYLPHQPI